MYVLREYSTFANKMVNLAYKKGTFDIVNNNSTKSNHSPIAKGFVKGFDELFKSIDIPDAVKGLMFETLARHLDMTEVQKVKTEVDKENGRLG